MYHPELSDNEAKNSREARDKAQKDRVQSVTIGGKAANGIIAAFTGGTSSGRCTYASSG